MQWFDQHAPAIQALAAVGIFFLTMALVWATWKYARLVEDQLRIIHQQSIRQQPAAIFKIQSRHWEIYAYCRNVGEPSLMLDSIKLRLSAIQSGDVILDCSCDAKAFLKPGRAWGRTLTDGLEGRGLVRLPRPSPLDWLRRQAGPPQPSGLLTAEGKFSCGGDSFVVRKLYAVHTGVLGAKLEELEAEQPQASA